MLISAAGGQQKLMLRGPCQEPNRWAATVGECPIVTTPMVLVATWRDGLFVVAGETLDQELRNQSVGALAPDGRGGALAIVNGRSLRRRAPDGVWSTIATTELDLACCVAVGDVIYVGSDDARVLRVGADGELEQLRGFDAVAGRDTWYAGSAADQRSARRTAARDPLDNRHPGRRGAPRQRPRRRYPPVDGRRRNLAAYHRHRQRRP